MRQCSSTNSLKQCRSALFCLRALSPLPSLDEGRYHTLVRRSCPPDRGRSVSLPRKRRLKRLARNESCTQDGAVERCEQHKRGGKDCIFIPTLPIPTASLPPCECRRHSSFLAVAVAATQLPLSHPEKKRSGPEGAAKKCLSLRSLVGHIRRPERRRRRVRPPSPLPSLPRRQHNPARPPTTTGEEEERGGRPRATEEGRSRPPPPPPASPLLILSSRVRQAFLPSLFWVRVHSISSFDSCWRRQCRRRRCRLPPPPLPRVAERGGERGGD